MRFPAATPLLCRLQEVRLPAATPPPAQPIAGDLCHLCEGTVGAVHPIPQFHLMPAVNEHPLSNGQDLHFPCHTRNPEEHLQVDAMADLGNCVPGSAVISEAFLHAMGIQDLLIPANTHIKMANKEGQPLQVIGKLQHLYMTVSHTLILHLHHITVVRDLSHPLIFSVFLLIVSENRKTQFFLTHPVYDPIFFMPVK